MNIAKKIACLLIAAAMCAGGAACGKQQETESETTTETTVSGAASTAEPEEEEEDDSEDDAPIDLDKVTVKGKETTAPKETKAVTTTATTAASTAATTAKAGQTTAKNDSKTTQTQTVTEALTDPAPETDVPAEEAVVEAVIHLDDGSFEGEGVSVDGGTIRITGSGTYILYGSRTGMVEVNTTEKVKLKLNGVNINNPDGPAILCTDAKRLTITLIEGTYNELSDGGSGHDGTITSNDTLEIKGAGTLRVNGNAGHGISSDDDIIIKNGDITVNAVKSGLMANDDVTVSGGTLHVTGQTNGIKSKGTLHISGGSMWIIGGPKETKSALFSGGPFSLTGGNVYALGCGMTEPDGGSSTQHSIAVRYSPMLESGTAASINVNGGQIMWETSPYAFSVVFVSTPDINEGMTFTAYANGEQYGEEYTVSGLSASAAVEKTVQAENEANE